MIEGPNELIDYGDQYPSDRPPLTDTSGPHATNVVIAGITAYRNALQWQRRIVTDHPSEDVRYLVGRLDETCYLLASCSIWTAQQWLDHVRYIIDKERNQ